MGYKATQNSFAGGEISPRMFGRIDLEQYEKSVALLRNWKVLPHGGAFKRSGTVFSTEVKDSSKKTHLIPFNVSADVGYQLEFGENYIRFLLNGAYIGGGTPIEIVTTYTEQECAELNYIQSADILWLVHQNHVPRQLRRLSEDGTSWDFIPSTFIDGPYMPINSSAVTISSSVGTGTTTLTASAATFAATDVGRHIRQYNSGLGTWAWAEITAYNSPTSVTATIVSGTMQGATDKWKLGKYSDTTGWPKTVSLYEARIGYAGSTKLSNSFDLSQTDKFDWFQQQANDTLLATDALGEILG